MRPSLVQVFAATEAGRQMAEAIARRLRATLHDDPHLPRKGAALVVGNHTFSGLDSVALGALLVLRTGRAPRFLAERNLWKIPGAKAVLDAVGAIPGAPDDAVRLLDDGEVVVVYPGGVDDSFKVSSDAYRLQWKDRAGFARVAMRAKAPIVPMAATGIDELFEVPRRESVLGRLLLGSSRYDIPLLKNLVPRAVPLDFYLLPPVDTGGDPADAEAVERVRRETYEAIEGVLAAYRAEMGRGGRVGDRFSPR